MMRFVAKVCIIAMLLLTPTPVFGASKSILTLEEGRVAPFSGTLLSSGAAAEILIDKELAVSEFKLKLDHELEMLGIKHKFEIEDLSLKLKYVEKSSEQTIAMQKEHISFLTERVTKMNNPNTELWFALGVGTGVVIVLLSGVALHAASN